MKIILMAFNIVPPKVANVSEKAGETENMW